LWGCDVLFPELNKKHLFNWRTPHFDKEKEVNNAVLCMYDFHIVHTNKDAAE
jgi:hypothetical protein